MTALLVYTMQRSPKECFLEAADDLRKHDPEMERIVRPFLDEIASGIERELAKRIEEEDHKRWARRG